MRKIATALAVAASLVPFVAQAADTRPTVVSYAAPTNLGAGMRAGARVGAQSRDDNGATLVIALAAAGAGVLAGRYLWHHTTYRYVSP